MTVPTPDEATAALAELAAGRRAVAAEERRRVPVLLGAWSALALLDYAAKDHVPDRRVRRLITGLCQVTTLGLGLLDHRARPVQPVSVDPADTGPRAAAPMAVALAGWVVAERLLVRGLRRSGAAHPNTLAGIALAVGRPVGYLGVQRLLPRPRTDG
ncbi:hypothetical protein [Pseudonocardia humida]|uniref:Uncharacterized protein n=1 Tax=Pseudonocardia humida TaxID=2800819 RepID=A0ABT1A3P5_9PSEU|nr:hypothetical protein [Pseudonocardia humida]MCO1657479.1 hypothetical protein [Pseudonocardia humida]